MEEGPWLSDEVRADIGARVVAGAKAVGYKGLATFEFLRDSQGEFYFLEVNPRVQVEHTVTEMITGYDLVSLGIRVASGESLPLSQDDIEISGHSIQARLNAEDPRTLEPSPVDFGNAIGLQDLVFGSIPMLTQDTICHPHSIPCC